MYTKFRVLSPYHIVTNGIKAIDGVEGLSGCVMLQQGMHVRWIEWFGVCGSNAHESFLYQLVKERKKETNNTTSS